MRKYDLLNIASDLKRAAKWVAFNQVEKADLIRDIFRNLENDKLVKGVLSESMVNFGDDVFSDEAKRAWFADQSLMASIKLTNLAMQM